MKIIGLDGKEYQTVEQCEAADTEFEAARKAEEESAQKEAENEKALASKQKKDLAEKIDNAQQSYNETLDYYLRVKQEAEDNVKKARAEANKTIREAAKEVEKASSARMEAIAEFNRMYGPYRTSLTGDAAKREFDRIMDMFDMNNPIDKMLELFRML